MSRIGLVWKRGLISMESLHLAPSIKLVRWSATSSLNIRYFWSVCLIQRIQLMTNKLYTNFGVCIQGLIVWKAGCRSSFACVNYFHKSKLRWSHVPSTRWRWPSIGAIHDQGCPPAAVISVSVKLSSLIEVSSSSPAKSGLVGPVVYGGKWNNEIHVL